MSDDEDECAAYAHVKFVVVCDNIHKSNIFKLFLNLTSGCWEG